MEPVHKHPQHNHHRHLHETYPKSSLQWLLYTIVAPLVLLIFTLILLKSFSVFSADTHTTLSISYFITATSATFVRLLIAYVFALIFSIPLALLVEHSPLAERIFLPFFDIVQSVPVLAFFPIVIVSFIHIGFIDGAAIAIIFLSMLWNMVFSLVGGLKVIPADTLAVAEVFGVKGFARIRKIYIPASVPYLVTGSLLAWAQGWNIIIVAEVLHTYIPGGTGADDLFGIGSTLVQAAASGATGVFVLAIFSMIIAIALINFFAWQPLLHFAERFKFE